MARKEMVTLTNMCLIEDKEGKVVVQIRDPKRYRWSGVAFPGGHIEEGEVRWVEKSDLSQMDLAYDLLEILKVMDEPDLSEFFYTRKNDDGEWDKNFR
ncbi:hypothetical protein ACJBYS_11045 [Streptococcus suis]|nr:NUDIX hydrolase [Streptococcus suis]